MATEANNTMAVNPPEATPAPAASSNATPELSSPANRWQFTPPPKYPPTWWQESFLEGFFSQDVNYEPGTLNPESWVVTWTFGPETPCRLGGSWPTPFPTATDAVLWLRFHVLPQLAADPQSTATAAELISRIDLAPAGTDAVTLLIELKPDLVRQFPKIEITAICTVHEWLSTQGTEEEFRRCYGTEEVTCRDGRWEMPQLWWDRIAADLLNNEMECLSVQNGHPNDPEPTAKFLVTFASFSRHLKSGAGQVGGPSPIQILGDADVIVADDGKGNRATFYGTDVLEDVASGKIDDTTRNMTVVVLDGGHFDQQTEELRKIVVELKGSCCYRSNPQDTDEGWYMFTTNGNIQYYDEGDKHGMVLAPSRSMAEQYAAQYQKNHGVRLTIAKIGTVPGETLEALLDVTFKTGATCAFVIRSLNETGGMFDVLLPPGDPTP